jgi:hypothetical protein
MLKQRILNLMMFLKNLLRCRNRSGVIINGIILLFSFCSCHQQKQESPDYVAEKDTIQQLKKVMPAFLQKLPMIFWK